MGMKGAEDLGEEGPELLLYRAGSGLDQCVELLTKEGRLQLGDSRSPSPSARSPSPSARSPSPSPELTSSLKVKKMDYSGAMNATQSTRVPSPSPTPSHLATSRNLAT